MTNLEAYQKAINAIDDYFEYRNQSVQDRLHVQHILDTLNCRLKEINDE